jgi:hypothetical protein
LRKSIKESEIDLPQILKSHDFGPKKMSTLMAEVIFSKNPFIRIGFYGFSDKS